MDKCACGHPRSQHKTYFGGGRNTRGSLYVCTKNGCDMWKYCDLSDDEPEEGEDVRWTEHPA
jgi:hypothetical protein